MALQNAFQIFLCFSLAVLSDSNGLWTKNLEKRVFEVSGQRIYRASGAPAFQDARIITEC